jgi:hypothetical protein
MKAFLLDQGELDHDVLIDPIIKTLWHEAAHISRGRINQIKSMKRKGVRHVKYG